MPVFDRSSGSAVGVGDPVAGGEAATEAVNPRARRQRLRQAPGYCDGCPHAFEQRFRPRGYFEDIPDLPGFGKNFLNALRLIEDHDA